MKLQLEHKSTQDRLKRLREDISIFKKNLAVRQKKMLVNAKNNLLNRIIPALDELERAINVSNVKIKSKKVRRFYASFRKNLKMVYNSFIKDTELTINTPSIGDPFNEKVHGVLGIVYEKNVINNSIAELVKNGYAFNDEILRPAQVVISTDDLDHPNLNTNP